MFDYIIHTHTHIHKYTYTHDEKPPFTHLSADLHTSLVLAIQIVCYFPRVLRAIRLLASAGSSTLGHSWKCQSCNFQRPVFWGLFPDPYLPTKCSALSLLSPVSFCELVEAAGRLCWASAPKPVLSPSPSFQCLTYKNAALHLLPHWVLLTTLL